MADMASGEQPPRDPISMCFHEVMYYGSMVLKSEKKRRLGMFCLNYFGTFVMVVGSTIPPFTALYSLAEIAFPGYDWILWYISYFIFAQLWMNFICFWVYHKNNRVKYWIENYNHLLPEPERSYIMAKRGDKIVIKTTTNSDGSEEDDNQPLLTDLEALPYCTKCDNVIPRRSHHCKVCDVCVLRKDHHCFLFATCVGLANERYFLVYLFYVALACFIGAACALYWLYFELNSFNVGFIGNSLLRFSKIHPLVCVFFWVIGYETFFNTFISLTMSALYAMGGMATGYFGFEMYYLLNGQTMHDFYHPNFYPDGDTASDRLRLVFGNYWFLNFFFPLFWQKTVMTPSMAKNILCAIPKEL
uniref:Palmitoyltransferase n=1 Tax=Panagrellus redivivus TaxID=6233 RepID=A0A7E4VQD8_PANRE